MVMLEQLFSTVLYSKTHQLSQIPSRILLTVHISNPLLSDHLNSISQTNSRGNRKSSPISDPLAAPLQRLDLSEAQTRQNAEHDLVFALFGGRPTTTPTPG